GRAIVLGEFGGLGWPIKGHLWKDDKKNWGYRNYEDEQRYVEEYSTVVKNVYPLISRGLSAAIYTQTSDVELEVNGLMTYDRKVLKVPAEKVKALHQQLFANYSKADFLINDSEVEPSKLSISTVFPGKDWLTRPDMKSFQSQTGPAKIKAGNSVWSVSSFNLKNKNTDLAMK